MTTTNQTGIDRWRELTAAITADDLSAADVLAMLDLVQAALASRESRR